MAKPDLYELTAQLHDAGLTQGMIARLLGYSKTHVARVFRELGITGPRRWKTPREAYVSLPPDLQRKVLLARGDVTK